MSGYNLSERHRKGAINGALQAAVVGLHHAAECHYTQDARRWSGINTHRDAAKGQFPPWTDCSAFVTWCYWNGLYLHGGNHSDRINGLDWKAGYTGTMLQHGRRRSSPIPGCAIIYGPKGSNGEHTALYTGGGKVISMGSDPGPFLLNWQYRSDVQAIIEYIY